MGTLIPYEKFKEKQREKKYGSDESRINRLRAKNIPEPIRADESVDPMDWIKSIIKKEEPD